MSKLVPNVLHAELRALIASSDTIKVMTMKVSKGLGFPVVALPGVGHMPVNGAGNAEVAGYSQWRLRIWGKARNMKRPRP